MVYALIDIQNKLNVQNELSTQTRLHKLIENKELYVFSF